MSLFKRIKNVIRSNINSSGNSFSDIDLNVYRAVHSKDFGHDYLGEEENPTTERNNQKTPTLEEEYYANLELPYGAGFDEIKSAYKRLLKKYHPDKFYGDEKKLAIAQDVVKKLNKAYEYFCSKYN